MQYIVKAFPDTPRIFLYRDPVEVLVSNLSDLSQTWVTSEKILGRSLEEIAQKNTLLENFAIGIRRICEGFLRHFDDNCRVYNYNQLSAPMFEDILSFFRIQAGPQELEKMMGEMNYYSKNRQAVFSSDVHKKQKEASPEIRRIAGKHLSEAYMQLESLKKELVKY